MKADKFTECNLNRTQSSVISLTPPPPSPSQGPELTKVIQAYNKMAVVFLQYEALHLCGWSQAAESAPPCLNAPLLVRQEDTKV